MKKLFAVAVMLGTLLTAAAQTPLSYYLPKHLSYDQELTAPSEFFGHDVGQWHLTHDKLSFLRYWIHEVQHQCQVA